VGAQLCETDTRNCAPSNEDGRASIPLPIAEETSVTLVKDGHASYLFPVFLRPFGDNWDGPFDMATDGYMVAQFDRVDSRYPMLGTGSIEVAVFPGPDLEGTTFELVGATGEPFYWDEESWWTLGLKTTSSGGGGFVEVTPGDQYQVRVGGTADKCTPVWGWAGDDVFSFRFPLREGYMTRVQLQCFKPEDPFNHTGADDIGR